MTARSVLASLLLGESPPSMPVSRLVRAAGIFGINENRSRVALSRMVARGELTADHAGVYSLAGPLSERASRLSRARAADVGPYDGTWHAVVVTASGDAAAARHARRAALRAARLGELRDGVWMRPANLEVDLAGELGAATVRLRSVPEDPAGLAAACFDLAGWARRARALEAELAGAPTRGDGALARGFELSAAVLRHLQRDPLLPAELLEEGWPGPSLRRRYAAFDAAYRSTLASAHRRAASR